MWSLGLIGQKLQCLRFRVDLCSFGIPTDIVLTFRMHDDMLQFPKYRDPDIDLNVDPQIL